MATFNFNMVVLMATVASMALGSTAMQHIVGGGAGWVIPSNPNLYAEWASKKDFMVGDSLLFEFVTGTHDVTEVSKEDYHHCHVSNRGSTITSGPANISLNSAGDHYYICSLEGHCAFGQKLAVHVVAANTFVPSVGF